MADRVVSVKLKADVASFVKDTATAHAATRALRQEAERFDGSRYSATVNVRDTDRAVRQIRGVRGELRGLHMDARALRLPALAAGGAAGAPALASMVGSASQLLGIVGLLPAAMMGGAAAIGVIAAGTRNFTDAVGGSAEAMAKLTPNAREAAVELLGQADAWRGVARGAQEALFNGQAEQLDEFGRALLPVAAKGAADLATQLGAAGREFLAFASRADSVADAREGLALTADAASRLGAITTNLSAVIADLGVVGGRELPALAGGLDAATARLRDFVATSRANGDLAGWIRGGIAEGRQLGSILFDLGGIMAGVGRAAEATGIDTVGSLERMTDAAHRYVDSWQGQAMIRQTLAGIHQDAVTFLPGLRDLAGAAVDFVSALSGSGTLAAAGTAFSDLTAAARPTVAVLSQLTGNILRPMLQTVSLLAPALGPLVAGMLAFRTASAAIGMVQTRIDGLAGRFDKAARAASGSADATSRVGGALRGIGTAMPLIGLAVVGVAGAYELLRDKTSDAAASVLNGSATIQQATNQTYASMRLQASFFAEGGAASVSYRDALAQTNAEIRKQIDAMPPLQAAQAMVTWSQQLLNDAVSRYGPTSDAAAQARGRLTASQAEAEVQELANRLGVDLLTAAQIRNRDAMLGSSDASIAWHAAIDRATESVTANGRTLDLNTAQGRANQTALNDLTRAARDDVAAKVELNGVTTETTRLAQGHEGQLYNTARALGMTDQEARDYVASLNLVPPAVNTNFTTPGLDDANNKAQSLWDKLKGLAQNWSASVSPIRPDGSRSFNPNLGRYATGGPLRGPGTGTSDDILLWGSDGEWMIRERVARQQGDARMGLLNAGLGEIVPKGGLPGYARGGPLNGSVTIDFRKLAEQIGRTERDMFPPLPPGVMMMGGNGTGDQLSNARIIAAVARRMGFGRNGLVVALATALQESGLRNINYGDRDSVGLFQQRTSQGWGSIAQIMNPGYSASKFFQALRGVRGWERMPVTVAAQRVQRSAFPNAYAKWVGLANRLASQVGFHDGGVVPGTGEGYALVKGGERVLTTGQTTSFDRLVDVLDRPTPISPAIAAGTRGGDGGSVVNNNHFDNHFAEAVDVDLFSQRFDFLVRSARC